MQLGTFQRSNDNSMNKRTCVLIKRATAQHPPEHRRAIERATRRQWNLTPRPLRAKLRAELESYV